MSVYRPRIPRPLPSPVWFEFLLFLIKSVYSRKINYKGSNMYPIISKEQLAEAVFRIRVKAPEIARKRRAGQFIIYQLEEDGERVPLTIVDSDDETITLIFQAVGVSTQKLSRREAGDNILNLVGPLGKPTHIQREGRVVCVGGGIGVAPVYPITKALKEAGNTVIGIIGARTRDLVILEKEMGEICDEVRVCTDDGSYGEKGLVTDMLQRLHDDLGKNGEKIDRAVAIGPPIMMKFTAKLTAELEIPTVVSLNPIMVDGTGMCGGCRVIVGGETKFACVDGPEFDGHQVDFDNLMARLQGYRKQEQQLEEHYCRLEGAR
jgi:ferredoxin/flavodoxin---NADP+ reductase